MRIIGQITKQYYFTLMSHSWLRHKAIKITKYNGSHQYDTYWLVELEKSNQKGVN